MDRRTFLVLGAAAVGLAGCTTGQSPPPAPPSAAPDPSTPSDPDARRRLEVAASEVTLIAAYRSAIQDIPAFGADLAPFLAQHEAHLARVAPGFVAPSAPPSASPSASPVASPAASPVAASSGPATSASPEANASSVLGVLVAAETAAQRQRATACDGADDPNLARDLCLIAASEAQHAAALTDLAARESAS